MKKPHYAFLTVLSFLVVILAVGTITYFAAADENLDINPDSELPKTAYLTFDDGPTDLTPEVLRILKEQGAVATFFVCNPAKAENKKYFQEILDGGNELGIHSYCHEFKDIFQSAQAYFEDYHKMQQLLLTETGQEITQFRIPWGSRSNKVKTSVMQGIIQQADQLGAVYYDWNVSAEDANHAFLSKSRLVSNIMKRIDKYQFKEPVILMHDIVGNNGILEALPEVIEQLRQRGYTFGTVSNLTVPVQYRHTEKNASAFENFFNQSDDCVII